jgi:hypothetical protein
MKNRCFLTIPIIVYFYKRSLYFVFVTVAEKFRGKYGHFKLVMRTSGNDWFKGAQFHKYLLSNSVCESM